MALKTYDGKEVSVIVGVRPLSGKADGTFVTVEYDEDNYTKVVGADGEVARAKSNNKTGKITVTLMQTASDNAYLSGLDLAGTVVPVFVRDASGRSLHASEEAWVLKSPNAEYGKETGEREWVLDCANLTSFHGGN